MQYENTLIYQRSLELVALTRDIISNLPVGFGFLADQIRRASSSVALNFAEGYAKATNRDQRRFFIIARGSACEVAAILDVASLFGVIDPLQHLQGKKICHHLACMLTKFRRL